MVATMAWNTIRHMETWYGIMGLGAVVHTLNPRLSDKVCIAAPQCASRQARARQPPGRSCAPSCTHVAQDIKYIMTDAKDVLLLSDISFVAQLARILPHTPACKGVVFLTDRCVRPGAASTRWSGELRAGSWTRGRSLGPLAWTHARARARVSARRQNMPLNHGLPCPVYCYEELLGAQAPALAALAPAGSFKWTQVDENAACGLCYTRCVRRWAGASGGG